MSCTKHHAPEVCYCRIQDKEISLDDVAKFVASLNSKVLRLRNDIVALRNVRIIDDAKSLKKDGKVCRKKGKVLSEIQSKECIISKTLFDRERSSLKVVQTETHTKRSKQVMVIEKKLNVEKSVVDTRDDFITNEKPRLNVKVGTPKVKKKKISRGVQYDEVMIKREKKKRTFFNCFKRECTRKKLKPLREGKKVQERRWLSIKGNDVKKAIKTGEKRSKNREERWRILRKGDCKFKKDNDEKPTENLKQKKSTHELTDEAGNSKIKSHKNDESDEALHISKEIVPDKVTRNERGNITYASNNNATIKEKLVRITSKDRIDGDESSTNDLSKQDTKSRVEKEMKDTPQKDTYTNRISVGMESRGNRLISEFNDKIRKAKQYKNIKSDAKNVKRRLDVCIAELNGIIGDVALILPNKTTLKDEIKCKINSASNKVE